MATTVNENSDPDATPAAPGSAFQLALPAVFVAVLLLLGTAFEGAFETRSWAPPLLFVLVLLGAVAGAGGGAPVRPAAARVAVGGIWAVAVAGVVSALWADAPASALESGLRTVLYAAVFTVPIVVLRSRISLRVTAGILIAGIAAIAVVTVVRLLAVDTGVVVAGRLDAPVGYRNATALLFCLGFWPLVALAARAGSSRLLRSVAFSAATLELGLAFLTQSRGVLLGFLAGGIVMVSLGPDRVRRAWLAIVAVGLLVACSGGLLTMYDAFDGGRGVPTDAQIVSSGKWVLVLAGLGAVVGGAISVFDSGLRRNLAVRSAARIALVAVLVLGFAAGLAKVGNPVSEVRTQWDEFRSLQTVATGSTRYFNAGGQRYDLWRVALNQFADHPVAGVGAGNFGAEYYESRRNDRNLDDPHGLPFQMAAELGIVGLAALLVFLGGVIAAVASSWRRIEEDDRRLAAAMVATGAVLLGQSMVDWMWRIPGVAAVGVFCLGVGVAVISRAGAPATRSSWLPMPSRVALAAGAVVLAGFTFTTFLGDYYVRAARAERGIDPARQLTLARRAQTFSGSSLPPYYLEASALETTGRVAEARKALQEALREVPSDFTTLALLGDLEARAGRYDVARTWYRRAHALNPVDVGLQQLAQSGGRPPARGR
jgi:O-antigen ligase